MTNCLNFGSPEDPAVMWQLAEAVRGLADGCKTLGIPVTGGNVSLYNQTGATAIYPTPVIGVLGVHDDVRRRLGAGFDRPTAPRSCCSARPAASSAGPRGPRSPTSTWAAARPPSTLTPNAALAALIVAAAAERGLLASAHDLSDGGLAIALAEACLHGGRGCAVTLRPVSQDGDPFTALFSESAGRALVSVVPGRETEFAALCAEHAVPATVLGTAGGDALSIESAFEVPLAELERAWTGTLPAIFGS